LWEAPRESRPRTNSRPASFIRRKRPVLTPHGMGEKHYIVKHTVLTTDGKLIGEKTFAPTDTAAESSFPIPDGFKGTLWVTSFCNIHDLWLTEFTV
jgi:superoxide reductase